MGLTGRTYGIFTPEEIAAQEQTNNLYQAIGILLKLQAMFYRNREQVVEKPQEIKDDEDNEDNLKKNRGEATKKRGNNCVITEHEAIPFENVLEERYKSSGLSCGVKLFTQAEQSEINEMLNEVSNLSKPSYYAKHETYLKACEYLEYLKGCTYGKEQTTNSPEKSNGKPTAPKKTISELLKCSNEDIDKVIDILKQGHEVSGPRGVARVLRALEKDETKYCFKAPRVTFWRAASEAIGKHIGSEQILNRYYNEDDKEANNAIAKIRKLLP